MSLKIRSFYAGREPHGRVIGGAAALCLVAVLALSGCRFDERDADYFPLDAGWSWHYRVVTEIRKLSKERTAMLVANRGAITVAGRQATPRIYQDGHRYYYAAEDDGIVLVAQQAPGDEAMLVPPDQYVIKFPIESGSSWPVASKTYLLRRQMFSPTAVIMIPITAPMKITFTVESKDDVVKVPAGTFRNCVRVHGVAKAVRDLGERVGDKELTIDVMEWFAPGVGLVKMVRHEDSHPESLSTGTMTVELENLDNGPWFN